MYAAPVGGQMQHNHVVCRACECRSAKVPPTENFRSAVYHCSQSSAAQRQRPVPILDGPIIPKRAHGVTISHFIVPVKLSKLFYAAIFGGGMEIDMADLFYSGNPFITAIFTADPSAHSWDGKRLYVYASHDMDPPQGCDLMDRYHVFSTSDMAHWLDEGEVLSSKDVEWGRPEGGFMWAPDCACKDGIYYLYYPHPSSTSWNDTWKIGVAVSEFPNKGFKDKGYIEGVGGFAMIDPCVFRDDDEEYYLYTGGGGNCAGGILNEDLTSMKNGMQPMEGLYDFHEATWVFKRDGRYYLMYSDNMQPENNMRYAISDHPLGPWKHMGIILNPVGCETTHGSIAEFKGKWYLFYHNQAVSGFGTLRSVCVNELFWNEDGTIRLVEQTSNGISAVDESYREPHATRYTPECVNGDKWTLSVAESGRVNLSIEYDSGSGLSKFRLYANGEDFSLLNATSDRTDKCSFTLILPDGGAEVVLKRESGTAVIRAVYAATL